MSLFGDIFGGVLGLIGTSIGVGVGSSNTQNTNNVNLQATRETNQMNKELAEKANRENRISAQEAQQFNERQSDKAYARSTPTNQIRELIAAGYTPQQAKEIVADSGSAASYSPASAVTSTSVSPTLNAPQQSPFIPDVAGLSSSLTSLGSSLGNFVDDLTNPNGGSLGYFEAEPLISEISLHISDIPKRFLTNPHDLHSWLLSHSHNDETPWVKDNISKIHEVFKKPNAARALQSTLMQYSQSFTAGDLYKKGSNEVLKSKLEIRKAQLENDLLDMNVVNASMDNALKALQVQNAPTIAKADFMAAQLEISRLGLEQEIVDDPNYRLFHLMQMIGNERNAAILAAACYYDNKAKYNTNVQKEKWTENADNAALLGVLSSMHDVGMTSNMIGALASVGLALGLEVPSTLAKLADGIVNPLLNGISEVTDVVSKVMNVTNDKAIEILKGIKESVKSAGSDVIDFGKLSHKFLTDEATRSIVLKSIEDSVSEKWTDIKDMYNNLDSKLRAVFKPNKK